MIRAGLPARKAGFTIAELLVVAGIFFLMFLALTPFVKMARGLSCRNACANNLREISLGLHAYAADHDDAFPTRLEELCPNYVASEKIFDCPASRHAGTKEYPDYSYVGGLKESSALKETIAADLDGNHGKSGRNILRINGSVEWAGRR